MVATGLLSCLMKSTVWENTLQGTIPGDTAIGDQRLVVPTSHQPPRGNKSRALMLLSSMGTRSKRGTGGTGCRSDPRASSKTWEAAGSARGSGITQCKCLAGPFMPLFLSF